MRWIPLAPATLSLVALLAVGCDDGESAEEPLTPDMMVEPEADMMVEPEADAMVEADAAVDPGPAWCSGPATQLYDPFASTELDVFPDDLWTVDETESPTGLRVMLDPEAAPWVDALPKMFRRSAIEMTGLTGFGSNGGIVVRFDAPMGEVVGGVDASMASEAVMLWDLDAEPPTRVPYSVRAAGEGATLIFQPLVPLRAGARHGLVVTTALEAAEGGCAAPSDTLKGLLTGTVDDPRLARVAPRYAELLAVAGVEPAEVSAATVFTVHRDLEVIAAVAADVQTRDFEWQTRPTCEAKDEWRVCEGTFEGFDYRDDGRAILTPAMVAPWTLTVRIWLPVEQDGPVPTLFVGHGLGSDRFQAERLAKIWTPRGYAVVAMDALKHGDHPTSEHLDGSATALGFLGIILHEVSADGRALLGNFNQTVVDRLQGLRLVRQAPDIDGDGEPEFDVDHVAYYGVSLGGLLGPGLASLDPELDLAVWQVPGGHLTTFITDNGELTPFMPVLIRLVGSEERFERLLPVLQAAIDSADPATWAPYVLRDRMGGGGPLSLLMAVSTFDEVVPPSTGRALARALGIPHVGPIFTPVELLEQQGAPIGANLWDGAATAGYTQLDRITDIEGDGMLKESRHASTPLSPEAQYQAQAFVDPWVVGEMPVVVDPYAELGTPEL